MCCAVLCVHLQNSLRRQLGSVLWSTGRASNVALSYRILNAISMHAPQAQSLGQIMSYSAALYYYLLTWHPYLSTALNNYVPPPYGHMTEFMRIGGVKVPTHDRYQLSAGQLLLQEQCKGRVEELIVYWRHRDYPYPDDMLISAVAAVVFRMALTPTITPEWWDSMELLLVVQNVACRMGMRWCDDDDTYQ